MSDIRIEHYESAIGPMLLVAMRGDGLGALLSLLEHAARHAEPIIVRDRAGRALVVRA